MDVSTEKLDIYTLLPEIFDAFLVVFIFASQLSNHYPFLVGHNSG